MTDPLFDMTPAETTPAPPKLSAGARLTQRQRRDITNGWHPLSGTTAGRLPLHAEASRDPQVAGARRCGNCRFRRSSNHHDYTYPKCTYPGVGTTRYLAQLPRFTRGPASDCRAWWPGCQDHEWETPE